MLKSKNSIISKEYIVCTSLFSKMFGLMFSRKKNLIFSFDREKRISLHMLFVFFPIWVVYLDKNKVVVFIKKLFPFVSSCYPKEKAQYILELVKDPKLNIGARVDW